MNKKQRQTRRIQHLLAASVLLGLGCGVAQAQSTVTVYGRVVAGINYQSNVDKKDGTSGALWGAASNQWGTSMFGFKGTEDLGGGLNAFFLLESGFDATKGKTNGDALFNRRSYVGLSGSAGSLKLGKNLALSNDIWYLDPTGQQWTGSANLVDGRNWQGANNVIEYETPKWGGLSATLQTSLGEQVGSVKKGRKDGISVVYANSDLELRAIYELARDANGKFTDVFLTSKELIVGGTYTIDKLKLFAGYENLSAPDAAPNTTDKINHYWLGANYALTPAVTLIGSAFRSNANNNGGSANLFVAGVNYALSKRTLLYATVGTVRNGSQASYSAEAGNNPMKGQNQNGTYLGIAHSF